MSARRAVLLILGVVTLVLALSAGAFAAYREYDNTRVRADQWRERADQWEQLAQQRSKQLKREAARPLSYERGEEAARAKFFKQFDLPDRWYMVYVGREGSEYGISEKALMRLCQSYWVEPVGIPGGMNLRSNNKSPWC